MTDRTLQRMIHVGCRQLGIDSDTRHDLQLQVTGKASMSDMTEPEMRMLLDALKQRGFKPSIAIYLRSFRFKQSTRDSNI